MRHPDDGGVPARRAVIRWSWRLFRRDWRQHLLILALLAAAVAAAIGFSCAAYNIAPTAGQADFGDANASFQFNSPDADTFPGTLDEARVAFGEIDPIGHRRVAVPGSDVQVDYRSQDPGGPYGAPLLRLRAGRYPTGAGTEAAVTEWVAETTGAHIGATIDLDGTDRLVVGVVENPSDLHDRFVLLPPSSLASSDSVTMLVDANHAQIESFRPSGGGGLILSWRGDVPQNVLAAVIMLVVSTLVLFLVALIAAASFTVIAQRRLPQLGMMSAIGATARHLRLSMLATGAATGVVASLGGAVLGVGSWIVVAPRLENVVGARIDSASIPWWVVVAGMLLAVVAATAAAWWPGRTVSNVPTVVALSGRPPRPVALERSVVLAGLLVVAGAVCLATGSRVGDNVSLLDLVLIAVGMLAVLAGVLLLSPIAIRTTGRVAARAPVAPRLALRDLARYQSRSGAALAAIALAIGIPVAIVAATAAAENQAGIGNLSPAQLLVQPSDTGGPFVPDAATVADMQAGVDELAAALPDANVLRLDAAMSADVQREPQMNGTPGVSIARQVDDHSWNELGLLYLATPELVTEYGLQPDDVGPGSDVVGTETGDVSIIDGNGPPGARNQFDVITSDGGLPASYSSLPHWLIGHDALTHRGWISSPSGRWLVETPEPLTSEQRATARRIAAQYGFVVEARDTKESLANLRHGAVAVGMLLALAILAMTVGLMRSESAGELRTLTAAGAPRRVRRSITATTASVLAGLGAVLGIAGAYVALTAGGLSDLTPVPVVDLAIIAIGTPLAAGVVGWLVAGREPTVIARRPIE